jgi:hypothetical protein
MAGESELTIRERWNLGYEIFEKAGWDKPSIGKILYYAFGDISEAENDSDDTEPGSGSQED